MGRRLLAVLLLLSLAPPCLGDTIVVDITGSGDYTAIQPALNAAREGDTVLVKPGEYVIREPLDFNASPAATPPGARPPGKDLVLRSEAGPESTVIRMAADPADPDYASVFVFGAEETRASRLEGLTLIGGQGCFIRAAPEHTQYGGGIFCIRSNVTIADCIIRENEAIGWQAGRGGGVACWGCAPALQGCVVTNNQSATGGGIYCYDSVVAVSNCIVEDNVAFMDGGGVCSEDSNVTISDCRIAGNRVSQALPHGRGGGVAWFDGSVVLEHCEITGNAASSDGGGVFCRGGESPRLMECSLTANHAGNDGGALCCTEFEVLPVTGCFIQENMADGEGGGIWGSVFVTQSILYGNVSLGGRGGGIHARGINSVVDCTIVGNSAKEGGGVYHYNIGAVRNCIVWHNAGGAFGFDSLPSAVSYSCIEGDLPWEDRNNIEEDPLFCGWGSSGHAHVDPSATGSGDGSAQKPYASIAEALRYSVSLSEGSPCRGTGPDGADMGAPTGTCPDPGAGSLRLHLAAGEYSVGVRSLAANISVEGEGADRTILDATLVGLRTGSVLENITVRGSGRRAVVTGGQDAPEIRDCVITRRTDSEEGGGLLCAGTSSPAITQCTFLDNAGKTGGGLEVTGAASAHLDHCEFVRNSAEAEGGAVHCRDASSATAVSCVFTENLANRGGGVHITSSSGLVLEDCSFRGNGATTGAALLNSTASTSMLGCLFTGNVTTRPGGAAILLEKGASAHLSSCTLSANWTLGGSVIQSTGEAELVVRDCIVWGNLGNPVNQDETSNTDIAYSCVEGVPVAGGEGNINEDPLFCGWGELAEVWVEADSSGPGDGTPGNPFPTLRQALDYEYALSAESPCLSTGQGGANMGLPAGTCADRGIHLRRVHIAEGVYHTDGRNLMAPASLLGAGPERAMLVGSLFGLRSGTTVADLSVVGGRLRGISVSPQEAPEIVGCVVRENTSEFLEGAGLFCGQGSAPRVNRCTFASNTQVEYGREGSGVYCAAGSEAQFTDCIISGHVCTTGSKIAGVHCAEDCSPVFIRCTISENTSPTQGGYGLRFVAGSTARLEDCIIRDTGTGVACYENSAPVLTDCLIEGNGAGGVYCEEASPTLTGCRLSGNSAEYGAAMRGSGFPRLTDCTIEGNWAEIGGGAIFSLGPSLQLERCTLVANGAGIFGGIYLVPESEVFLTGCILWDNAGGSLGYRLRDDDEVPTFSVTYSCVEAENVWEGEGNINVDPLFCGFPGPEVVEVDPTSPGPEDGSPGSPFRSLADALLYDIALSAASPCRGAGPDGADMGAATEPCQEPGATRREVHLAGGYHDVSGLTLVHKVSLLGEGQDKTTVTGTVLGLRTGSILQDLTITGGTPYGLVASSHETPEVRRCTIRENPGRGVLCCSESSPVLESCWIVANSSNQFTGGGVACSNGAAPRLRNCVIEDNVASRGGGLLLASGSRALVTSCWIRANSAEGSCGCGGGVAFEVNAASTLRGCRIVGNSSELNGGGISCDSWKEWEIDRCIVAGNSASQGGGLWFGEDARGTVSNCLIAGNSALASALGGGGVALGDKASVSLWNCTITENRGGALYNCTGLESIATTNCIVWGNIGQGQWGGTLGNLTHREVVTARFCCFAAAWPGDGNIVGDPGFLRAGIWEVDDWTPGDYHLVPDSVAVDVGTAEGSPPEDLEGASRPQGAGVDMGTYESSGTAALPPFQRGDAGGDGDVDISDGLLLCLYLFQGGVEPICLDAADVDDDGRLVLADVIYLLNHLFRGGTAPPAPYPGCGADQTLDTLGCRSFLRCE